MTGSFNGIIFFAIVFYTFTEISESLNFDLVYSLRKYFQSDVILLAKKENDDEIAKKLYKYKGSIPNAFIGAINIKKMSVEFILQSQISRFQNIMIVADSSEELMQKFIELKPFLTKIIASIVFVIFIKDDVKEKIIELYLPFHSRFLLVENSKNASTFEVTDVYQIGRNGSKIYSHFASWNEEEKLKSPKENFYFRRMDLRGHVIHTMEPTGKIYGKLWDIFEEHMNFTQNRVAPVYGGIYPNGTKTGIFKMMDDRILDGTQHNYKYFDERADYFDYIFPVYIAETRVYMAVEESLNWSLFIAPFRIGIWMALFFCMILSSITLFVTLRYQKNQSTQDGFGSSVFTVIQAICFQGTTVNHSKISVYTAYVIPSLLAMVIVNSYNGVFLSHLTVKNLAAPFYGLQEAVKDGGYKILVEQDSFTLFFLQTDEGETATSVRNKNLLVSENEMVPFESKKAAFNRLCNMEKLIYVTGTSDHIVQEQCNIIYLKQVVFYDVEGIVIWKGFPYKDIMTKLLKRIQFAGLIKLRRINPIVPYENPNKFQSLSLELILPIFLILICLVFLSIIMCIYELTTEKYNFGANELTNLNR